MENVYEVEGKEVTIMQNPTVRGRKGAACPTMQGRIRHAAKGIKKELASLGERKKTTTRGKEREQGQGAEWVCDHGKK